LTQTGELCVPRLVEVSYAERVAHHGASRGLGREFTEEVLKAKPSRAAFANNSYQVVDIAAAFEDTVKTVSLEHHR
jgi:hypothetical protein